MGFFDAIFGGGDSQTNTQKTTVNVETESNLGVSVNTEPFADALEAVAESNEAEAGALQDALEASAEAELQASERVGEAIAEAGQGFSRTLLLLGGAAAAYAYITRS